MQQQPLVTRICRLGAATLLAGVLFLPAGASSGRLSFPLTVNREGYFVTPVSLNNSAEIAGIIDTAATLPMVEARAASAAGIGPAAISEQTVAVFGLLGGRDYHTVRIPVVQAGSASLIQVAAAYNDRETMPGGKVVIPATAFGGDVLDFDFPEGRFTVYDGRPQNSNQQAISRSRLTVEDGLFFTEVSINGVKAKALIDTGSPFTLINSKFAAAAGVKPDEDKTQRLRGATGGALNAEVAAARRLTMARYTVRQLDLIVADPALFEDLGLSDEPAMLLGLDLLSMFRVQIDRRRGHFVLTLPDQDRGFSLNLNARDTRIRN